MQEEYNFDFSKKEEKQVKAQGWSLFEIMLFLMSALIVTMFCILFIGK